MPGASARVCFSGSSLIPNPSSSHSEGRKAKSALERARDQVAASLGEGVRARELTFVSSGTEAAQMAVRSVLEPSLLRGERPHWILTAGDHDAHMQMIPWLEARGGSASLLPLGSDGMPELEAFQNLWRPETRLVSAIWANNETGVLTDVAKLSRMCAERGAPLHLDGAQAWGKLPLDLKSSGASLVSLSGHKVGALAGTGVLWRKGGARLGATVFPGKQEGGLRGGTENLLGAVSLGAAASCLDPAAWSAAIGPLRDKMEREILRAIPGARIHGAGAPRIANTTSLGFEGIEKDGLVAALDLAGYCVSAGSACSSGITEPSHVLKAMGLGSDAARAAVRVSLASGTSWDELEGFVAALARAVEKARRGAR